MPGEKNTTQTTLDAVVHDIKSRTMLFRAPGVSQVKGSAAAASLTGELRRDSEQGPEQYQAARSRGYSGGGSLGRLYPALLAPGGAVALLRRRG